MSHTFNSYKAKQLYMNKAALHKIIQLYNKVKDMVFIETFITHGTPEDIARQQRKRYDMEQKTALYSPASLYCYEEPLIANFRQNERANLENTTFEDIQNMLVHSLLLTMQQQWHAIAQDVLNELEEYQMPDGQQLATFESVQTALTVTRSVINLMETQMQPLRTKEALLLKMNIDFGLVHEMQLLYS